VKKLKKFREEIKQKSNKQQDMSASKSAASKKQIIKKSSTQKIQP